MLVRKLAEQDPGIGPADVSELTLEVYVQMDGCKLNTVFIIDVRLHQPGEPGEIGARVQSPVEKGLGAGPALVREGTIVKDIDCKGSIAIRSSVQPARIPVD